MGKYGTLCKQVFGNELALIKHPGLQQFVVDIFDTFGHDGFFVRAASRSGRYHPQVNLNKIGVGGLVRHVRLATYYGSRFSRAFDGTGRGADHPAGEDLGVHHDHIVAALIAHDLMKDGDPERAAEPARNGPDGWKMITGCHGVDLCEAIWKRMLKGKADQDQVLVMQGIASHMGVWTLPESYRPANVKDPVARKVAHIVHAADYAAAQKSDDVIAALTEEKAIDAYEELVKDCGDPQDRKNTARAKASAGVAA